MIAILSALASEIEVTLSALESPVKAPFARRSIYLGTLAGREVVVGHTGIGKVLAAMTLQGVIDTYHPEAVLFIGIAGSLNQSYEIGDVIIAEDCLQHDFDATRFGYLRGEIPYEEIVELASDKVLLDHAAGWKGGGRRLHTGRILSGDRFVSTAGELPDAHLRDELQGDAVDMESASAALVAHLNDIPFLVVRIISDKSDGVLPDDFKRFMKESSALLRDFAEYFVSLPVTGGGAGQS